LVPVNAFVLLQIEVVRHQAYPTSYALFGNVVALLAGLMLLNSLLRRWQPRLAFTPAELLTCYIVLCAATAVSNDETCYLLVGLIGHVTWFGTPSNHWGDLFGRRLPAVLMVNDREALRGFYQGNSSFWRWELIAVWLPPLLLWLVFLMVLLGVMLCINALVRRPWTESQRLAYPLVTMPLQMTDPKEGFFRSRLMWAGFALTVAVNTVNGLHVLYPTVPEIARYVDIGPAMNVRPWTAFLAFPNARVPIGIFPFIFGLGLLMPLDLCFSVWFFYLLTRLLAVAEAARGWDTLPGFPYDADQASGAMLGISAYLAWQMRGSMTDVLRRALRGDPTLDDGREPMCYRTALAGAVLGIALLTAFAIWIGMSPLLALGFFVLYFALAVALTRMRAEAGVTGHDIYLGGPDALLVSTFGSRNLSPASLTALSLFFWFNRAYDAHPMPQQLEGFRVGERGGLPLRGVTGLLLLGAMAGAVCAFVVILHVMYQMGAASGKVSDLTSLSGEAWNRLAAWSAAPAGVNWYSIYARGGGLLATLALYVIRNQGIWCPFHPVGLAMAGAWSMYKIWSSLMLSWLAKWLFLRYGGRRSYQALVQFGLGLVLGDCVMGGFWALYGAAHNIATFNPWP
jgi:hypothetical protein